MEEKHLDVETLRHKKLQGFVVLLNELLYSVFGNKE